MNSQGKHRIPSPYKVRALVSAVHAKTDSASVFRLTMTARTAACVQRYVAVVLSFAVRSCLLIAVTTAILPAEVLTHAGTAKVLSP